MTNPASPWYYRDVPQIVWFMPQRWWGDQWEYMNRRLNPLIRRHLDVADVDVFYFGYNKPCPEWVNNYLAKYFTPVIGEIVESCGTETRRNIYNEDVVGEVSSVDLRQGEVHFLHGGMDAFQCVDPIGWRSKYLNEDGSPTPEAR